MGEALPLETAIVIGERSMVAGKEKSQSDESVATLTAIPAERQRLAISALISTASVAATTYW